MMEEKKRMTITIKGVPPSINRFAGRQNAWEYRAEKEWWTDAVELACRASKDRPREPWPFAGVEITYFFPDRRRRDADNYAGKFLLDGLTKAGVIVDDDLQHITTVIRGAVDRESPRTQVVITKGGERKL